MQLLANRINDVVHLEQSEDILLNINLFIVGSFFKNAERKRYAKRLVITTHRIIIIERNWNIGEVFRINEIVGVIVKRKWLISANIPVISIQTPKNLYDVYFYNIFPSYKNKIRAIVECIKHLKPSINIEMELKTQSIIKEIISTKIEFK